MDREMFDRIAHEFQGHEDVEALLVAYDKNRKELELLRRQGEEQRRALEDYQRRPANTYDAESGQAHELLSDLGVPTHDDRGPLSLRRRIMMRLDGLPPQPREREDDAVVHRLLTNAGIPANGHQGPLSIKQRVSLLISLPRAMRGEIGGAVREGRVRSDGLYEIMRLDIHEVSLTLEEWRDAIRTYEPPFTRGAGSSAVAVKAPLIDLVRLCSAAWASLGCTVAALRHAGYYTVERNTGEVLHAHVSATQLIELTVVAVRSQRPHL